MSARLAPTELNIDLHEDLLTASEAATLAGVTAAAVRQWKRRGHLTARGLDEFGRPLFTGIDVLRAAAKARANSSRTQQGLRLATRDASRGA